MMKKFQSFEKLENIFDRVFRVKVVEEMLESVENDAKIQKNHL